MSLSPLPLAIGSQVSNLDGRLYSTEIWGRKRECMERNLK